MFMYSTYFMAFSQLPVLLLTIASIHGHFTQYIHWLFHNYIFTVLNKSKYPTVNLWNGRWPSQNYQSCSLLMKAGIHVLYNGIIQSFYTKTDSVYLRFVSYVCWFSTIQTQNYDMLHSILKNCNLNERQNSSSMKTSTNPFFRRSSRYHCLYKV